MCMVRQGEKLRYTMHLLAIHYTFKSCNATNIKIKLSKTVNVLAMMTVLSEFFKYL